MSTGAASSTTAIVSLWLKRFAPRRAGYSDQITCLERDYSQRRFIKASLRRAISSGEQRIFKDRPQTTIGRIPVGHSSARSSQPEREIMLEARIAELEAELQARDDFLAIAAHELRNPMTPIRGRVELLLARARRMPGAVPKEIVQGLERLERLVDAYIRRATILLDVSRINSENLHLQLAEIDLSVLVRQGAMSMAPAAERAGSSISLKVQDGIIGHCDETAVEQILENLLSNAIRYGGAQPIEVAFSSDGDNARLSVRDQGIGISDQDQAQIFERFWRLDRKSTKGGFGVGLWITRQLVHAMQGEVVVSSKPGAGSTFAVTLPLSPRQTDAH